MTTLNARFATQDGLRLLLGPRQTDVMRFLWIHGPATAREVHTYLKHSADLAYTTVATICVRLTEMGLLKQEHLEAPQDCSRHALSYLYTPLISEMDFVQQAVAQQLHGLLAHFGALVCEHVARYARRSTVSDTVEHTCDRTHVEQVLAYLGALHDAHGQPADEASLAVIAALLERAEIVERQATEWKGEAGRAQHQAQAAISRAEAAERQAMSWEAEARRAHQRALVVEEEAALVERRAGLRQRARAQAAPERYDPEGICRVCAQPVRAALARRRDGLRVCEQASCRLEAQRRDNVAKQRQFRARQSALRDQARQS